MSIGNFIIFHPQFDSTLNVENICYVKLLCKVMWFPGFPPPPPKKWASKGSLLESHFRFNRDYYLA